MGGTIWDECTGSKIGFHFEYSASRKLLAGIESLSLEDVKHCAGSQQSITVPGRPIAHEPAFQPQHSVILVRDVIWRDCPTGSHQLSGEASP
jgi:hypothetical protein